MGRATSAGTRPAPWAIADGLAILRLGHGDPLLLVPYPHGLGVVGDVRTMA